MPKKKLISIEIFCELSKSGKIAIIQRNITESKIQLKGSGSNTGRDVKPAHQSPDVIAREMI